MNGWLATKEQREKIKDEINMAHSSYDYIDEMFINGYTQALMTLSKIMISKEDWEAGRGDSNGNLGK